MSADAWSLVTFCLARICISLTYVCVRLWSAGEPLVPFLSWVVQFVRTVSGCLAVAAVDRSPMTFCRACGPRRHMYAQAFTDHRSLIIPERFLRMAVSPYRYRQQVSAVGICLHYLPATIYLWLAEWK